MKVRAQEIMLKVLLAAGGVAVVVITWLRPMPVQERIISHLIGLGGLLVVLVWSVVSRSPRAAGKKGITSANVDIKD